MKITDNFREYTQTLFYFSRAMNENFSFFNSCWLFFLTLFWGFVFVLVLRFFFRWDAPQNVHIYLKIARLISKSPALYHWSNTLFSAKIVRFIIEFCISPKFCVYSRNFWLFPKSASKMSMQSQLLGPLCITLMVIFGFFTVIISSSLCWTHCWFNPVFNLVQDQNKIFNIDKHCKVLFIYTCNIYFIVSFLSWGLFYDVKKHDSSVFIKDTISVTISLNFC